MKKIILFILPIFLFCIPVAAQHNTLPQNAERQLGELLQLIEQGKVDALMKRTTDSLYCSLCFNDLTDTYRVAKKEFYSTHFHSIFNKDLLDRIKRGKRITVNERSGDHDILLLYATYARDEVAPGHEGAQLGFWLKEENAIFLLAGVETIP